MRVMMPTTEAHWPVAWSDVEDEQLHEWLRATPAQRLAWLEEMLEFARMAGALSKVGREKIRSDSGTRS